MQVMDRFLQLSSDFESQHKDFLVSVDSLTATYTSESEISQTMTSSLSSPFKGKGPEECSLLLQ